MRDDNDPAQLARMAEADTPELEQGAVTLGGFALAALFALALIVAGAALVAWVL
ncbi:hypothetical protein GCM10011452_09470 [Gemmobacter lanyuensis]|uniref:Uncharacterized protein n=1 Tax=Gemmobacter lanyuensis TaxID=1054497 RepID=A0A918INW5_9RHOB|nr:hypothetical protein [Gemmobacter lanyuensis]GGW24133.1 hypothetical protein GCM10011452_09470 [Gemmobacter lanyuensis]